jgi:hypothetical protein
LLVSAPRHHAATQFRCYDAPMTTPDPAEAKRAAYLRDARAQGTLQRLARQSPMRFRDYLIVAGGALAVIAIPLILLSFFL